MIRWKTQGTRRITNPPLHLELTIQDGFLKNCHKAYAYITNLFSTSLPSHPSGKISPRFHLFSSGFIENRLNLLLVQFKVLMFISDGSAPPHRILTRAPAPPSPDLHPKTSATLRYLRWRQRRKRPRYYVQVLANRELIHGLVIDGPSSCSSPPGPRGV